MSPRIPSTIAQGLLRRFVAGATILLTAALSASGCIQNRHETPAGYIQVDIETSPTSLDPRFATDAISSRLNELTFDALARVDAHGVYAPSLAESIERASATQIVFHLRRDAHFSDGRRVTSRDVKFTYDCVTDPASGSSKRAGFASLRNTVAIDDYTFAMETRQPYAAALEMASLGVVPNGTPLHRSGASPRGSGAFRIVKNARDDRIVMERNEYVANAPDAIRGIVFKVVPDPTVRALELAQGVADLAENNIQPDLLGYLGARPGLAIIKSAGAAYQYIIFNFHDPQLRDIRVRRAIAHAIDRDAIVKSFLRGTARVASGMLAPENWAYIADVTSYAYSPDAARSLLDEAGFPADATGKRALKFVYKTTPEGVRLAELIQATLRRVGIEVTIRTNEWATFYDDIQRGNFDIASMQWVGINDPHHYCLVFDSRMTPPAGLNRGYYSNPEMDRLVEMGEVTLDPEKRTQIYAGVQKLAASDLPYISLWWQDNIAVMTHYIHGFEAYPNGSFASFADLTLTNGSGAISQ